MFPQKNTVHWEQQMCLLLYSLKMLEYKNEIYYIFTDLLCMQKVDLFVHTQLKQNKPSFPVIATCSKETQQRTEELRTTQLLL